jgi:hypothetical protein
MKIKSDSVMPDPTASKNAELKQRLQEIISSITNEIQEIKGRATDLQVQTVSDMMNSKTCPTTEEDAKSAGTWLRTCMEMDAALDYWQGLNAAIQGFIERIPDYAASRLSNYYAYFAFHEVLNTGKFDQFVIESVGATVDKELLDRLAHVEDPLTRAVRYAYDAGWI